MSKSIKELNLHYDPINESNSFTSGDIVEGRVVLEVTKEIKVDHLFVKLTGDANVSWTESTGDDETTTYSDHERYFKIKQYFIQESSKYGQPEKNTTLISGETYGPVIKEGSHVFPFRFQLPQQKMPASFKGVHGSVKYVLMVKLKRPWKPTSSTCSELNFSPGNDGTNDHLLEPQSVTKDKKLKLFGSGKMSMTATTDKTGYMQGETIRVSVDIDNSSSRDVKPKYSLKQQQTFIAGKSTNKAFKDIVKETKDPVPSGEKTKFIVDIHLPHDLTINIENCRIIKVQYQIKPTNNVLPVKAHLGDSSHICHLSLTLCLILVDHHLHMQNFTPICMTLQRCPIQELLQGFIQIQMPCCLVSIQLHLHQFMIQIKALKHPHLMCLINLLQQANF
ncbi:arrestin domain-containing protein 3-like isoform X2 [Pseudorasbora parva]|uniref:arrestin domain-containing protein 3-like isoform X2 n=1 Tax=Pseudorasbora parva TaxID=51549 RepID=UPI00351E0AD2